MATINATVSSSAARLRVSEMSCIECSGGVALTGTDKKEAKLGSLTPRGVFRVSPGSLSRR
jgi:hypothetical protein